MRPTLLIMLLGMLTLLPAANALAQRAAVTNVVILKCSEDNDPTTTNDPVVHTCQATHEAFCADPCAVGDPCARCLLALMSVPRKCDGGSFLTSNVVVTQPSVSGITSQSIEKYTFACHTGAP